MLTIENHKTHLAIAASGQPLLRYQVITEASKPHFDAVNLPPDARAPGQNIALAAPHDHLWHLGLCFSQQYVDDVNFWAPELLAARNEPHGICRHKGEVKTRARHDGSVSFAHQIEWQRSLEEMQRSLEETWIREDRQVVIHPPHDGGYRFDWTMTLTAVSTDRVLKSVSEHGDYSGLSYRCVRAMDHAHILNSEKNTDIHTAHGEAARWADYSGKLDGCLEFANPYQAGLAIFDHPTNPGYPVRWFCMNNPFGFLAANRTFGRLWTLPADTPVTLRWGIFVHDGPASYDRIEAEHQRFARP